MQFRVHLRKMEGGDSCPSLDRGCLNSAAFHVESEHELRGLSGLGKDCRLKSLEQDSSNTAALEYEGGGGGTVLQGSNGMHQ